MTEVSDYLVEARTDGALLAVGRILARHRASPQKAAEWSDGAVTRFVYCIDCRRPFPCPDVEDAKRAKEFLTE